jgi:glyoxylase-like metal-dependent hydrolase (beta-lactamase superfamily II)
MTYDRVGIGHIELLAMLDGDEELDPIEEAFPDVPASELLAERDRYPGVYGPGGGWQLKIRAWLIRHPGGVVLVDTGVGRAAVDWLGAVGRLHEVLHETGTPPDAIDTVVISHVHDDHIGGTVVFEEPQAGADEPAAPSPAFPNARHLLQRADWEWQREAASGSEEDARIFETLLQPLEAAGLLDLVDGDVDLAEGIGLHHLPGHTPGHQIVRLRSQGRRAVISADTFNHPSQCTHPDWPSGPDWHHARSAEARRSLIAELFSHPGTVVAPTHLAESFGQVKAGRDGLAAWVPSV